MPWFKVDDGFHGHPKVVDASLEAIGLWTLAGSWCAKYLTDGFVPEKTVVRLGGSPDSAAELVRSELWSSADEGYQFKDWEDYQPLKADVEAERSAAQERMKKVRAAKKGVRANDSRTPSERSAEQTENFGRSSEEVRIAPSQSQSQSQSQEERPTRKRGSRLQNDWMPSEDSRTKARADAPDVDHRAEHTVFVDYWIAQPSPRGVKVDWDATWRNWMRRKQADLKQRAKPTPTDRAIQTVALGRPQLATELMGLEHGQS